MSELIPSIDEDNNNNNNNSSNISPEESPRNDDEPNRLSLKRVGKHARIATAKDYGGLAASKEDQGLIEEAETLYRRSLAMFERSGDVASKDGVIMLNNFARFLSRCAKAQEAESIFNRVLLMAPMALGPTAAEIGVAHNNLGLLLAEEGRTEEAEQCYLRAIKQFEVVDNKEENISHHAAALSNLASIYEEQNRFPEAEPLQLQVVQLREQHLGPDHSSTLIALTTLAEIQTNQKKFVDAERTYLKLVQSRERLHGPRHPTVARALRSAGASAASDQRVANAMQYYRRSLEIFETVLGSSHDDTQDTQDALAGLYIDCSVDQLRSDDAISAMSELATALQRGGRASKAALVLRKLLELIDNGEIANRSVLADTLFQLGQAEIECQKWEEAEQVLVRALILMVAGGDDEFEEKGPLECAREVQRTLQKLGRDTLAEKLELFRTGAAGVAAAFHAIGFHFDCLNVKALAESALRTALKLREKHLGELNSDTAETLFVLGALLEETDRAVEAESLLKRALRIRQELLGPDHDETTTALEVLCEALEKQGKLEEAETVRVEKR